jgi:hypothetical protein
LCFAPPVLIRESARSHRPWCFCCVESLNWAVRLGRPNEAKKRMKVLILVRVRRRKLARHPKFFGVELQGAIGEKGRFANLPLAGLFPSQLFAARSIEMRQVFPHEFPHYGSGNGFVIVAEHVADAGYLRPGDPGCLALSSSGIRRLASDMISTPRSTIHCLCQSPLSLRYAGAEACECCRGS